MTDIDWLIERHELLSVRLNREFGDSAKFHKKTAEALAALRDERDEARGDATFHIDKCKELQADNAALREVLTNCEAVLTIVEPRSHKAEYLECLAQVRAALKAGE